MWWLDEIYSMHFLRFLARRYEGLVKLGIIADYVLNQLALNLDVCT
jgi:hypothetical protein